MTDWVGSPTEEEFRDTLGEMATSKKISRRPIALLTQICIENVKHYKFILDAFESFLSTTPRSQRLHGLYIYDSVIKNTKLKLGDNNAYILRISQRLEKLVAAFMDCEPSARDKVKSTLKNWSSKMNFFTPEVSERLKRALAGKSSSRSDGSKKPAAPSAVARPPPAAPVIPGLSQFSVEKLSAIATNPGAFGIDMSALSSLVNPPSEQVASNSASFQSHDASAPATPFSAPIRTYAAPVNYPGVAAPSNYADNFDYSDSDDSDDDARVERLTKQREDDAQRLVEEEKRRLAEEARLAKIEKERKEKEAAELLRAEEEKAKLQALAAVDPRALPISSPAFGAPEQLKMEEIVTVYSRTLFVGSLDASTSQGMLQSLFSQFGNIVHLKLILGKNIAFIKFADRISAERARSELQGFALGGRNMKIGWGKPFEGAHQVDFETGASRLPASKVPAEFLPRPPPMNYPRGGPPPAGPPPTGPPPYPLSGPPPLGPPPAGPPPGYPLGPPPSGPPPAGPPPSGPPPSGPPPFYPPPGSAPGGPPAPYNPLRTSGGDRDERPPRSRERQGSREPYRDNGGGGGRGGDHYRGGGGGGSGWERERERGGRDFGRSSDRDDDRYGGQKRPRSDFNERDDRRNVRRREV